MPFSLEGFAFFLEAIFLGLYLYGWQKLGPRAHVFAGVMVSLGGAHRQYRGDRDPPRRKPEHAVGSRADSGVPRDYSAV